MFGPHDAYLQHLMPMTIVHNLHLVAHVLTLLHAHVMC